MKSENAPFNEFGQSMILRDVEDLYVQVDKVNKSLYGIQAGATSLSQQVTKNTAAIVSNSASIVSNTSRLTADEAAIAALQAQSPYRTLSDIASMTNSTSISYASSGLNQAIKCDTVTGGLTGYSSITGYFTPPANGVYNISMVIYIAHISATTSISLNMFYFAGGLVMAESVQQLPGLSGGYITMATSVYLTPSDSFNPYINLTFSGPGTPSMQPYIRIVRS